MIKRKRLFFDIETSPNIGFFWSVGGKQYIPYDNIIKERSIICICYKWEEEDITYSLTWDSHQDDKNMLEKFIEVANEAQELVAHNGDKFDLPWIRTRCLFHGIPMFPSYVTIDTLWHSRSKFRFNSNKLDYISNYLGVGGKISTDFDLWKHIVLENNEASLKEMVEYCCNDVVILEKVYNKISSYIPSKVHYGALENNGDRACCPECGSKNVKHHLTRYSALGIPKIQLQCKDCGRYYTVSDKIYKKF